MGHRQLKRSIHVCSIMHWGQIIRFYELFTSHGLSLLIPTLAAISPLASLTNFSTNPVQGTGYVSESLLSLDAQNWCPGVPSLSFPTFFFQEKSSENRHLKLQECGSMLKNIIILMHLTNSSQNLWGCCYSNPHEKDSASPPRMPQTQSLSGLSTSQITLPMSLCLLHHTH